MLLWLIILFLTNNLIVFSVYNYFIVDWFHFLPYISYGQFIILSIFMMLLRGDILDIIAMHTTQEEDEYNG